MDAGGRLSGGGAKFTQGLDTQSVPESLQQHFEGTAATAKNMDVSLAVPTATSVLRASGRLRTPWTNSQSSFRCVVALSTMTKLLTSIPIRAAHVAAAIRHTARPNSVSRLSDSQRPGLRDTYKLWLV